MGNEMNICDVCGANYVKKDDTWKCPACGYFKPIEVTKEELVLLWNASTELRRANFQDAEELYSDFIAKYPTNANGYWGRLLARYGIKYEEDIGGKKVPTIYAMSIESVLGDSDYFRAIGFANIEPKKYYEREANKIEELRKEWIDKASKEKPVDIFISFKDSDSENDIARTEDSYEAQELYTHLIKQGYNVFFSRENLRDKVAEKYEPYIFNALNTARVMIIYTSKREYLESTWIKNEWLRFLKKVKNGEKEKTSLILAYEKMSPSEFPTVFKNMQCMDASKKTFYGDLDNHLAKLLSKAEGETARLAKQRVEEEVARLAKQKSEEEVAILVKQKVEEEVARLAKQKSEEEVARLAKQKSEEEVARLAKQKAEEQTARLAKQKAEEEAARLVKQKVEEETAKLAKQKAEEEVARLAKQKSEEETAKLAKQKVEEDKQVKLLEFAWDDVLWGYVVTNLVDKEMTTLVIPRQYKGEPVFGIGDNAFSCCRLKSIIIPNSVTSIGEGAFNGCSGLASITIPNSVTSISLEAFRDCSRLKSMVIPYSVTSIGEGPFRDCSELTSISVSDNNSMYRSEGNCLIEKATNTLIAGCKTSIIPPSVTSIGDWAFSDCSGLTSITIPNSVTSIGNNAFSGCDGLTSITIPSSVTSLDGCAFIGCSGLTSIYVDGNNSMYRSESNCLIERATNTLIVGCKTSIIPPSVTSIDSAFNKCNELTSITIPNSVTSIGGYSFNQCRGLTSVIIPNSVTSIGDWAFEGCSGLTSITIPDSVTSIGDGAFRDWRSWQTIYVKGGKKAANSWDTGFGIEWDYGCKAKIVFD